MHNSVMRPPSRFEEAIEKLPNGGDHMEAACISMKKGEMARAGDDDATMEAIGKRTA